MTPSRSSSHFFNPLTQQRPNAPPAHHQELLTTLHGINFPQDWTTVRTSNLTQYIFWTTHSYMFPLPDSDTFKKSYTLNIMDLFSQQQTLQTTCHHRDAASSLCQYATRCCCSTHQDSFNTCHIQSTGITGSKYSIITATRTIGSVMRSVQLTRTN
jgi:hypothetical protein